MTFRDDHDAALARADALEQELEAERAKVAEQRELFNAERAERRRLEALLAERAKRQRAAGDVDLTKVLLKIALVIAFGLFVFAATNH